MRLNEAAAAFAAAARDSQANPVVYVETEEGVFCEVVGVFSGPGPEFGLKEGEVIVLNISDPEESQ